MVPMFQDQVPPHPIPNPHGLVVEHFSNANVEVESCLYLQRFRGQGREIQTTPLWAGCDA